MNLIEKIRRVVLNELNRVYTIDLGVILKADMSKMRCDVKLKHRIDREEVILRNIPIWAYHINGNLVFIPPKEGETVTIFFNKYELEKMLETKDGIVDVNQQLQFDLNFAFVVPGIFTTPDLKFVPQIEPDEMIIIHKSGAKIYFKSGGDLEVKAKNIVIKAEKVDFIKEEL